MSETVAPVGAIRFDATSARPPGERSVTRQWYANPEGGFVAGFWAADVGRAEIAYDKDELCTLIEGKVRLTDESGKVEVFSAGDTFLIPEGFRGVWETLEPVRKFFAVHRRKQA